MTFVVAPLLAVIADRAKIPRGAPLSLPTPVVDGQHDRCRGDRLGNLRQRVSEA